jgi:glycosyltransferase involved in cell wall biosynthesis
MGYFWGSHTERHLVMSELVTVVIPTFNKVSYIRQTVISVLKQNYGAIEILLVDNGSTDGTLDVIASMQNEFTSIRLIQTLKNNGPSGARNEGLKQAKGKYIFFLDGDDLFFPDKIVTQVDHMDKHPNIGLTLTSYLISNETASNPRLIKFKNVNSLLDGWLSMRGFGGLVESTGCIRSSLLSHELFYDLSLKGSEGLDFTKRWMEAAEAEIILKPLTLYRISDNQLHFDTAAISENVNRITKKFFHDPVIRDKYLDSQSSFFYLDSLRSRPLHKILIGVALSFDPKVLTMAFCISFRNFRAWNRGRKYQQKIRALMQSSSHLRAEPDNI